MAFDLADIDPVWAWSPFEPTATCPWDVGSAAHLYRRAGFGANFEQLRDAVQQPPDAVVRQLIDCQEPTAFRDEVDGLAQAMVNTGQVRNLSAVWLHRMMATPHQLLEKMTFFWHGHFATSAGKVTDAQLMLVQHQLLRRHALGRFDRLVQEISRDPAMLIYLDSDSNRKSNPNENYARELMELFCLGEGNYTEQDIREIARCFTGWQVRRKQFRLNRYQHDAGTKTIFGKSGEFSGDDAIRIVLEQPSAPQFVAAKLVRFLVFDRQQIPHRLLEPLARQLRENDFQVAPVIGRILGSQLFYSEHAVAQKIRSPVELGCGLLRALEGTTNTLRLAEQLDELGQALFFPPNVKGWDGGRTWINSATLLGRANLVYQLLHSEKTRFAGGSLETLLERHGISQSHDLVDWLEQVLLAVRIPGEVRQQLARLGGTGQKIDAESAIAVVYAVCTLPEFQLN